MLMCICGYVRLIIVQQSSLLLRILLTARLTGIAASNGIQPTTNRLWRNGYDCCLLKPLTCHMPRTNAAAITDRVLRLA
uniref:Putative secreted protein n=1 Tax=Anopheles darlingi TaxID=43151 RepID=A0A2M4DAN8_ANODA